MTPPRTAGPPASSLLIPSSLVPRMHSDPSPRAHLIDHSCLNTYSVPAFYATELGCIDISMNESTCEENSGMWLHQARNRTECAAHGCGCVEVLKFSSFFSVCGLITSAGQSIGCCRDDPEDIPQP
jgi:hypothetical protein